jgi:RNA polymerase sigma-70 factor (sigma-E family)
MDLEGDFEGYVQARGPALLRVALLLTGQQHAAEDLTQAALEDALVHWGRVRRADHPDLYVQRMLLNRYLQGRRRRSSSEVVLADPDRGAADPDRTAAVADRDQVQRLLARLAPRARAMLVLRYYLDLADASIAAQLGVSPGTVRSTLSRALQSLRVTAEAVGDQR